MIKEKLCARKAPTQFLLLPYVHVIFLQRKTKAKHDMFVEKVIDIAHAQ